MFLLGLACCLLVVPGYVAIGITSHIDIGKANDVMVSISRLHSTVHVCSAVGLICRTMILCVSVVENQEVLIKIQLLDATTSVDTA